MTEAARPHDPPLPDPRLSLVIPVRNEAGNIGALLDEVFATLPYTKERFILPPNLHIIGTMNTADRSLAGLDVALRRRFVFEEMPPRPDLLGNVAGIDLQQLLIVMNNRIEVLLGRDHLLGHAYFIGIQSLEELKGVFRRQILPLLQEYFFDDWERIALVLNDPRKAKAHQFLSQPTYDELALFGKAGFDFLEC